MHEGARSMVKAMNFRVTYIGTATLLLEIGSLRIITDPAFDQAGQRYHFGFGTSSTKHLSPSCSTIDLGRIDAVLLTHDQHDDNLDDSGRKLLATVPDVISTRLAAKRLGPSMEPGKVIHGLAPFETQQIVGSDGFTIEVTATPARHGPICSGPIVGPVIGFALSWDGQKHVQVYISGDTVYFRGIRAIADRLKIGTAFLHLGGVRFRSTGPIKYTFDGHGAVKAAQTLGVNQIVPVHYEGWEHFRESRAQSEKIFAAAGLTEKVRWLQPGSATELST